MNGYSLMSLGIALLCAFLSALHLALWRAAPKDRLQLALAIGVGGMAILNFGFAGSSGPSAGALGWTIPFLVLTALGIVPAWLGSAMMIWSLAGCEHAAKMRRALMAALAIGSTTTMVRDLWWIAQHWNDAAPLAIPSWEDMARSWGGILGAIPPAGGITLSLLAVVEGTIALVQRKPNGALLIIPGIPALLLTATEAYNKATGSSSPTLIGLIGLPFILVASTMVIFRYGAAIQSQEFAGDYRLVRKLASGGMGELFLATRRGVGGFERPVALKRVLPSASLDEKAIEKLLAEARMSAKLVHPNIVSVQDVGRLHGTNGSGFGWFIAMEWLPGVDLVQVRDVSQANGTLLPAEFVASVAHQVCRGLTHAHAAGIVHRDVSPHNVMVTFDGAVKIVDFGVALKHSDGPVDEGGYLFGKIAYSSPEQIRRNTEIGPASDLFSLGIVMYELLSGIRPFRGSSMMEIADAVMKGRYLPLDQVRPGMNEALVRIVHKALDAKPAERFASAEEMGAALSEALRSLPAIEPGPFVKNLCPEQWKTQKDSSNELYEMTLGARPFPSVAEPATRRV